MDSKPLWNRIYIPTIPYFFSREKAGEYLIVATATLSEQLKYVKIVNPINTGGGGGTDPRPPS